MGNDEDKKEAGTKLVAVGIDTHYKLKIAAAKKKLAMGEFIDWMITETADKDGSSGNCNQ